MATFESKTQIGAFSDTDNWVMSRGGIIYRATTAQLKRSLREYRGALIRLAADSAALNVSAGAVISFAGGTVLRDTDGIANLAAQPTRLTVPAGWSKVRLRGVIAYTSTVTANSGLMVGMFKNGVPFDGAGRMVAGTGAYTNPSFPVESAVVDAVAGDYFELCHSCSDTSVNLSGTTPGSGTASLATWFELELVA